MSDRAEKTAEFLAAQHSGGVVYENLPPELAPADIDEAYEAQDAYQRLMAAGPRGRIAGRKIALSSKPMQEFCGVDHPIAGAIFANEIYHSPAKIRRDAYMGLGLEFEMAFTFGEALGPSGAPYDEAAVRAALATCRPAFEMIEDRRADYSDLDAKSMIADNAWCGGIVLGEEIPNWRELDLDALPSTLRYNDEAPVHSTSGLSNPMGSLVWVVNHVTGRGGTMAAGDAVITGSVIETRYPAAGDRITYEFDGLASVSLEVV